MRSALLWVLGVVYLCNGQNKISGADRGLLHRRPLQQTPCWSGGHADNYYDPVENDAEGRKFLLAAGAAVGGAALGYHLGMKHNNPVVINNNIHNEYPSPCIVVGGGGGGGGGGSGVIGGGGIVSGILSHHPILSNILQGGLWNGNGGGGSRISSNRQNDINWNRAIRQFNRAIRPLTRDFK